MARKKSMKTIMRDMSVVHAFFSVILLDIYQKKLSQIEISKLCQAINLSMAMNYDTIRQACQSITLTIADGYYKTEQITKLAKELQKFFDGRKVRDKTAPKICEHVHCRGCETCQDC